MLAPEARRLTTKRQRRARAFRRRQRRLRAVYGRIYADFAENGVTYRGAA